MFPYEPPEGRGPDPNEPYPGIGASLLLTMMGMVASVFTAIALLGLGELAAQGIGRAIGFGAVASLALQRIPPPQARRLGLRKLAPDALPLILCLVPAVLLMSELDNYAYDWAPDEPTLLESLSPPAVEPPAATEDGAPTLSDAGRASGDGDAPKGALDRDAEPGTADGEEADAASRADRRLIDPDDPWSMIQGLILMVLVVPLIDGFFFYGVLQQGLVRRMGLWQGVLLAGLFWMLMRDFPITGPTRFVVGSISLLGMGWLLGMVRIATGSVLGPIALSSGWAAIGFYSAAYRGVVDWPGMNVEGTHLPTTLVLASLGIVAWATWTTLREAQRRYAETVEDEPTDDGRPTRTRVQDLRPPDPD